MRHAPRKTEAETPATRNHRFTDAFPDAAGVINRFFPILFFVLFFIVLQWHVTPSILFSANGVGIHHYVDEMHRLADAPENSPTFEDAVARKPLILELTPEFFRTAAQAPGTLPWFLTVLLLYACNLPFLGAFLITLYAILFSRVFSAFLRGIGGSAPRLLHYFPPLIVLLVCVWYELHYCSVLLTITGALLAAVIFQRLRKPGLPGTIIVLSVIFWLSWYLLHWGCLLALLLIVIGEIFQRKGTLIPVAVASLVNIALFGYLEAFLLPLDLTVRWKELTAESGLIILMIVFFPVAAILSGIRTKIPDVFVRCPPLPRELLRILCLTGGTIAAMGWFCCTPVNRDTRTVARTFYHILNRQWDAILRENTTEAFKGFPKKNNAIQAFMVHAVDRALVQTGRAGDRLFEYPQAVFSYDPLLMLPTTLKNGHVNWVAVLDLAMDLGMVNLAEKIAGETMENMGPYPEILYRRAIIQIATGNTEAAAVYLNRLSCIPFYGKQARQLLASAPHETAAAEPRIAAMELHRDTVDYLLFTESYESMLKYLLRSNTANKTAYDYLMTHCLLIGQIDGIAALAPAAAEFGYAMLPRYWEEALCIVQASRQIPEQTAQFGHLVRPQTAERFTEFAGRYMPLADDPSAAQKLASAFGDSYFFFSVFRYSPGARHE